MFTQLHYFYADQKKKRCAPSMRCINNPPRRTVPSFIRSNFPPRSSPALSSFSFANSCRRPFSSALFSENKLPRLPLYGLVHTGTTRSIEFPPAREHTPHIISQNILWPRSPSPPDVQFFFTICLTHGYSRRMACVYRDSKTHN